MRRVIITLAVLVAVVALGAMVWEPFAASTVAPPPAHRYDGRIVRDEFGVPHLFGKTDADVVWALAYAHAEDDFSTLQEVVAMTRGRAGAILGQDGAKVDYALHLIDARATVVRQYSKVPADVRALLDAYASGLNLYAARHPGEVRLAKLFPVNGADIATGFVLRSPFFFGMDETLGTLAAGKPLMREMAEPLVGDSMNGSNAFAVAPRRSSDGHTRLISNSHQPWTGGVAWYEVVLHSAQGWDFAGATFPGGFVPFLGHNYNLGWTNTVNRPDLTDVYQLVLDDTRTHYRFDGKWRPLEQHRIWLPVKFGPFTLPIPKTIYRSVHGPVIFNKQGAFAIHYAGMGTMGMLEQYYRITKAQTWQEWSKAMALHAIPATNFIYADRTGRIAHVYNAQFPARKPGYDYRQILRGDTSRNLASGTVPWPDIPQHVDPASGFLENSNNTPYLAAGPGSELDPRDYSPLLGIEQDVTNRALRGVRLMAADASISADDLLRIKFDTAYDRTGYAGRWFGAIARIDPKGDAMLVRAKALLATWDWTLDGKGAADALAALMLRPANRTNYHREPLPDARAALLEWSAHLTKHFGRLDPPLGALLRLRHGKVDLPLDGGPDVLRATALWDLDDDGRARVKHGDSFIMLIDWDKNGSVTSHSIQPFGAATTRPDSPHYSDQSQLFATHRFKAVHFRRDELRMHAVRAYHP